MELSDALTLLKKKGHRLTKTRKLILTILFNDLDPRTAPELQIELITMNHKVHKTTIYRELEFLITENIIEEIPSSQPEKLYEITDLPHHHHAACTTCGSITHFTSHQLEAAIVQITNQLEKENIIIKSHIIELYGTCKKCR
jgi:Fur family ferric uptake transcriptional regulator